LGKTDHNHESPQETSNYQCNYHKAICLYSSKTARNIYTLLPFWAFLISAVLDDGITTATIVLWIAILAWTVGVFLAHPLNPLIPKLSTKVRILFRTRRREASKALAIRGYTPLSFSAREFRLLTLHPAPDPNAIPSCELAVFALGPQQHPPYEALSWSWGPFKVEDEMMLNGKAVKTRQTLVVALKHLRYADRPRNLWVDAVCIDQGNIYEQGEQVRLMSLVYGSASRVLVWLGPGDIETDRAMRYVQQARHQDAAQQQQREDADFKFDFFAVWPLFERSWWNRI
jgi:hypothetical protein